MKIQIALAALALAAQPSPASAQSMMGAAKTVTVGGAARICAGSIRS
jgi:hypothetical protein